MGEKNRRRKLLLAQHPICCFCGGTRAAAEMDHFPSRAIFLDKHWPEGYEFPACEDCNDVTRRDELIVAMLSRADAVSTCEKDHQEFGKYLGAVGRNFPGLLEGMKPSARQLREARDKYGVLPPPGTSLADLPVLSLQDERIQQAVRNFGRKLALALYYKHTSTILPASGGITVRWYSNLQVMADEIPRELEKVLPEAPRLIRAARDLSEQFFYRVGVAEGGKMAVYLAIFRRSFAIVGFMNPDAASLQAPEGVEILKPYQWIAEANVIAPRKS